ncbi:helix-turn-helix domain-containing protein [Streptomyces sp. NPDC091368]|uniref:helix-turn-helix domain-containing protein n=1 Tax=Streptomyces sp. NPDC091368 TaxID=3365993 RepID=UPI003812250D
MPSDQPAWVLTRRERIGARIRSARIHADLSQVALAERCGVDHKTIHRIEYGVSDPSLSLLLLIAQALDVPLADLVQ